MLTLHFQVRSVQRNPSGAVVRLQPGDVYAAEDGSNPGYDFKAHGVSNVKVAMPSDPGWSVGQVMEMTLAPWEAPPAVLESTASTHDLGGPGSVPVRILWGRRPDAASPHGIALFGVVMGYVTDAEAARLERQLTDPA